MMPIEVKNFLKDVRVLSKAPVNSRYKGNSLYEYPFDLQLLTASSLYRESRKQYLELGGRYSPRISSTMRSLSAQDLFADEIDYTPAHTELVWFSKNDRDVHDPEEEIVSLERFSTISVFHEQNHRILWRLLPPASVGERALSRYLNFAESLVVMLDLALADEIGPKLSPVFERLKVIYRAGQVPKRWRLSKPAYRDYLVATQFATYLILELINPEDVNAAVDYALPGQKSLNRAAVARAFDINELFTRITNPQWQERNLGQARKSLSKMHAGFEGAPLDLPNDPLDFESEFAITRYVLKEFKI
jgi:hypothetical protein